MKNLKKYIALGAVGLLMASCDDFINVEPQGVLDQDLAYSEPEGLVNAAYAALGNDWYSYPFNLWPYGDMSSDDGLKGGSGENDTGYHPMEIWSTLTYDRGEFDELWYHLYVSISRCNRALDALDKTGADKLGEKLRDQRVAEVKFLRAHFYYKLLTMFYQVPWVDVEVFRNNAVEQTSNTEFTHDELMKKVIADFEEAYNVLPEKEPGTDARANKIAAAAYLAKCYLDMAYGDGYEANTGYSHVNKDYMQKVLEYTKVVEDSKYGYLEEFGDIFLPEFKNSKESVFAVQHSDYQDDNTTFGRANWSNMLNGTWGIWSCGWDFHKASQNLVNAFKTKNGLPMFDDFDEDHNVYPKMGVVTAQKYDPRLFHTVGMPTYPYKYETEYTLTTANSRTPNTYGYYTSMKEVPQRSKGETYDSPWQAFAMNDYVFRYTDVMLMRAEAMIETDDLDGALEIINAIRGRAMNSIDKHIAYAKDQCDIAKYPEFKDKDYARQALRWERRLELAMEGHRYFDLRRWGLASKTLNEFFKSERNDCYDEQTYALYYKDAFYTADKNEYFPLPYNQLYYVPGLYKQNKNY